MDITQDDDFDMGSYTIRFMFLINFLNVNLGRFGCLSNMKNCLFCFHCGILEHVFKACFGFHEEDHLGGLIDFKYGMWLLDKSIP